ncbi:adenylate kinase [Shewanella surugensis]|uniref:Adenylate kinase n=1 Tax=Shewanella surugensis TaxID=212020 RepID=A0ABT0LK66_9GAMM|nr:adenylate kinase [Shewanella surugensis]MCL1127521.1 adenylate kinase [Shewanella surugensis]
MKKVAVFGNAGAGKSTCSEKIATTMQLPLYALDKLQYVSGGIAIPHIDFLELHNDIISRDTWVIDGYGCLASTWKRLDKADTLIYIDLPLALHFFWVTKRFIKGLYHPTLGWPEDAPLLKSTYKSYRVIWLCHKKLTPTYRRYVTDAAKTKTVYHLRSKKDITHFLNSLKADNNLTQ